MKIKDMRMWTTGIEVDYGYAGNNKNGWSARCNWRCKIIGQEGYIDGEMKTPYRKTIGQAIDEILILMNKFDIKKCNESHNMKFYLYIDEESDPSEEVINKMKSEAKRRGWEHCF